MDPRAHHRRRDDSAALDDGGRQRRQAMPGPDTLQIVADIDLLRPGGRRRDNRAQPHHGPPA
jgi:hypothetical protein